VSSYSNYSLLNNTKNALLLATNLPVSVLYVLFNIVDSDLCSSETHKGMHCCVSMTTVVTQTCATVMLYVYCLYCFFTAEYQITGTEEALREYQESGIIIDASALKRPLKVCKHPFGPDKFRYLYSYAFRVC